MRLAVLGIGLRGPGLDGWAASRAVLTGEAPHDPTPPVVPAASLLPANERRRAPASVKLALAAGAEAFAAAGLSPAATPAVFTSSGGDGETIHGILETLAGPEPALSPTRFHNSVHNVAAGYWSIATASRAPTTSLCAHDGSFAAGLIEAGAQAMAAGEAVALIAYDMPYPGPLAAVRRIAGAFAVALVLAPDPETDTETETKTETETEIGTGSREGMRIGVMLDARPGAPTPAFPPGLEPWRRAVPAARCLPLLAALARGAAAEVRLDYLPDLGLILRILPGETA
jgi:hypothetical protein